MKQEPELSALAVKIGDLSDEKPTLSFAGLLRQLRTTARLTQEELARAAGLSPRSISDLERGVNRTARKETALLLADALGVDDRVRTAFVAAARGRAPVSEVRAAMDSLRTAASTARPKAFPQIEPLPTRDEINLARLIDAVTAAAAVYGEALAELAAGATSCQLTLTGRGDGPESARVVLSPRHRRQCTQYTARFRTSSLRTSRCLNR